MMSSPIRLTKTSAGRFLLAVKSERGNGKTTTSPFTNLPMPCLPPACPNLWRFAIRWQTSTLLPKYPTYQNHFQQDTKQNDKPQRVYLRKAFAVYYQFLQL